MMTGHWSSFFLRVFVGRYNRIIHLWCLNWIYSVKREILSALRYNMLVTITFATKFLSSSFVKTFIFTKILSPFISWRNNKRHSFWMTFNLSYVSISPLILKSFIFIHIFFNLLFDIPFIFCTTLNFKI
jgi:hypothetical protein